MKISNRVLSLRWAILAAWMAAAGGLSLLPPPDPAAHERESFMPAGSPHRQADAAIKEHFPHNSGLSRAVVIFERGDGPLTGEDRREIERIARDIEALNGRPPWSASAEKLSVRSPASILLPGNPLISSDGRAAIVLVSVPADFITIRSSNTVDEIEGILERSPRPAGLTAAVTGSSGVGHDYALAAKRSYDRTLYVTIASIIIILLVVYRSPVAAMVPLVAISLAAVVASQLLMVAERFGLHVGMAEQIFALVLLYGAGTDYSLLLISRHREHMHSGLAPLPAAGDALRGTFPAILTAASTNAMGLFLLVFARYGIFSATGPAVAISLVIAMAAAVTLVPALLGIMGKIAFWPSVSLTSASSANGTPGIRRRMWAQLADVVTRRPWPVLLIVLALLAAPAVRSLRLPWVYDTLAALSEDYEATAGIHMAERHWPVGEVAPIVVLASSNAPRTDWPQLAQKLTDALVHIEGVGNVRSLYAPLGRSAGLFVNAAARLDSKAVRAEYQSEDGKATRLEVVLDHKPLTLKAMSTAERIRQVAAQAIGANDVKVQLAGATAEMIDIRNVTQGDFRNIAAFVLVVILIIVLVLMRDLVLSAFMVASTVLSYMATLGICFWVFRAFGAQGLDWKVEVFLFVMMVAVGVDYNIFLAARLAQEAAQNPVAEATRRAIINTGPVISSCGLIMAATLGSLMTGHLSLLKQLGFALSLGMLIDSFVVRPLLLPAFVVITRRTGKSGGMGHSGQ